MAATVILFIILLLLLIVIMIFSFNVNIIVSFFASTDNYIYDYAVNVNKIFRTGKNKKRRKKSSNSSKIIKTIKKSKEHIEISDVTILGNISFGDSATTALSAGILNILAGNFVALLSTYSNKVTISQINIKPIYNEKIEGEVFFECILKGNLGNIIINLISERK